MCSTRHVIVEHEGVVCGTSRGVIDSFVRVVSLPARRIVAVVDGHTCGWDGGVEEISRPVLDGVERALRGNPDASMESLFKAAREAFLVAAEPYPDDDLAGGPAAQLTVAEISPGRLRAGRLGRLEVLIAREGDLCCEAEPPGYEAVDRVPRPPSLVERPLFDGDFIIVSRQWVTDLWNRVLPSVIGELSRAHHDPRSLVEAAIARWKDDVRRLQEAGTLIGEPQLTLVALRGGGPARDRLGVS